MTEIVGQLRRAARDLRDLGQAAAVIGGLAVSVRTEPRFTRDIDFAVAASGDQEAERAVSAWLARGYRILAQVEQEEIGRLATVRLATPGAEGTVILDLLFASSGIEPEIVAEAEELEVLPSIMLPVARVGHLIATKLLSRDDRVRPQDQVDLRRLLAVADQAELDRAAAAVRLMTDRGFARDRDLVRALEEFLRPS